nr:class F sortase [Streptomyces phyllanthi]
MAVGALVIHNGTNDSPTPRARSVAVAPAAPRPSTTGAQPGGTATRKPLPRSVPKRISIPEITVDAPFTGLSIGESGQLDAPPPDDPNLAGWFEDGASPGEAGSSIVVGHVDTTTGPAVFADLLTLRRGSTVDITRADGIVARFKVDSVATFSKEHFPNERVYGDTRTPQLRLITCGGVYNRTTRDYESNVVVFAHLDSAKRV